MPNYCKARPWRELCGAVEPEEPEYTYDSVHDVPDCYIEDWMLDHEEDIKIHFEE